MKKVFPTLDDVVHVFAQRTQNEGRSGNIFFTNDKIYSYGYHYCMGQFLDKDTILINNSGYSSTTSSHISILSSATSHYKQFFTKSCDLDLVHSQVVELKDKLSKARKPELYLFDILGLFASLNEYLIYIKAKKYKSNKKYKEIKKICKALETDKEGLLLKLKEQEKKKAEKEQVLIQLNLAKFLAYEIRTFRIGKEDFLRVSQDGKSIETTQGVKVTMEGAKNLYKLIALKQDIKGYNIEGYTVTSINGTLQIGCHKINIQSVHTTGKKILTDL